MAVGIPFIPTHPTANNMTRDNTTHRRKDLHRLCLLPVPMASSGDGRTGRQVRRCLRCAVPTSIALPPVIDPNAPCLFSAT